MYAGEADIVYIAGTKGVYRHVLGGSSMEQVIDNSLTTFGKPEVFIVAMCLLENNEFLALFTDNRLIHFYYDYNVATVPNNKLKVYSLYENEIIKQGIYNFQIQYPNYYVEYEIGLESGSSLTPDDAMKKLNTKILSGEGPDVYILDQLNYQSLIEKELLADLSELLTTLPDGQLFQNILEAFTKDGNVYMIPASFQIPFILVEQDLLQGSTKIQDLSSILAEMIRRKPNQTILGYYDEEVLTKELLQFSGSNFIDDNKSINGDELRKGVQERKEK